VSQSVSPPGPEREPLPQPDTSVVHYDLDTNDLRTACGLDILRLLRDSYSTDPAAVDCPRCAATLVDGQLAEPAVDTQPLPAVDSWVPKKWCDDEWHYSRQTPAGPCPGCGQGDRAADQLLDRERAAVGCQEACCAGRTVPWPVELNPHRMEQRAVERLAELVDEEPGPAECRCRPSDQDPCDDCPHPLAYRETAPPGAILAAYDAMKAARTTPDPSADTQPLPAVDAWVDITALVAETDREDEVIVEIRPAAVDPVENPGELAPPIGPVPPPAEHRTVSLEVLTNDLRWAENARRRDDAFEASKLRVDGESVKADLLPPAAQVGIVLRLDGEAVSVPETDAMWLAGFRQPPDVLAAMLQQARFYADDHDGAEMLMPTPDVLATLAGQPVGGWTATVESRWGLVKPGWLVLVETMVADERDSVWLLVEDRVECTRPDCPVAQGTSWACAVTTIRGRGIQHLNAFNPCSVRIPADQPAPAVTA
jgi:hypothetical protein